MNMMKVQDEREGLSAPAFVDMEAPGETHAAPRSRMGNDTQWDGLGLGSDPEAEPAQRTSLFDRFTWLRNQRIGAKVNAIFGIFMVLSGAVALILTVGLSDIWLRYHNSAAIQQSIVSASSLGGTVGDLRYNTSRFLFEQDPEVLRRQRAAYT
ncbi:MAG: hypothetical protein AAFR88_02165, partial [Pseudomonadota bacterium]